MSILKSILHRYNTTNQNYDTLHPETEHAQVTDFGQGVIAHLASSTLVSLVTSVSTGSVFGKMVEKLLEASGVQYNFTNSSAWYICIGSLFGGLIIQGGSEGNVALNSGVPITLPISYNYGVYTPLFSYTGSGVNATLKTVGINYSAFQIHNYASGSSTIDIRWMAIGF